MGKLAKVEGEATISGASGMTEIEFYEEEFILDDKIGGKGEARQLIRRALLVPRLQKKIKGFRRVRTCQIIEFKDTSEKPQDGELDLLLKRAMDLNCIPLNIDNYKRPDYKIKALKAAITDTEARLEKKKQKKGITEEDHGYID